LVVGLDDFLEGSASPGVGALRRVLEDLLGGPEANGRLIGQAQLAPEVCRVRFAANGRTASFVVKRLGPGVARRNQLLAERWLPAVGLSRCGPPLRGAAAEPTGRSVWHVYEDLGDCGLDERSPDPVRVEPAVQVIARLHTRFAGHALLPECRLHGGDLGAAFYASSVRDAIHSLEALRSPAVDLSPAQSALRDRLLERVRRLLQEEPERTQLLREFGGPETLLHGDLWPKNVLVLSTRGQMEARLIDWDRAGVGPVSYDLSTFLGRFPTGERLWILDLYRQCVGRAGWDLPPVGVLNRLFDTAECARLANCIIWRALAVWESQAEWAFHDLASLEEWLGALQPVLPS
jgi:Phosphotransferase enzyme family